jgi:hypothetical protein
MTLPQPLRALSFLLGLVGLLWSPSASAQADVRPWQDVPAFEMKGGLAAYWNVYDWSAINRDRASERGFLSLTLVDPFASRANGPTGRITGSPSDRNPWVKPPYFESTVKADLLRLASHLGPGPNDLVLDIEHEFDQNAINAWNDPESRAASRIQTQANFESAYFQQWASWFNLPAQWAREMYPGVRIGFYGPQPFRRDYWGIAGKDAQQIDGTHANDALMWQFIDSEVDFYVASIYIFYDKPDSVFYMASNVEENFARTRQFGDKPVYAYQWMRYHGSNKALGNRELDPYLAEAMALVPFFSGAKAVVLWGHEPQILRDVDGHPYAQLGRYVGALQRVAGLSEKIGRAKPHLDPPAHVLWNTRQPLVRRMDVGPGECVILALNPWQGDDQQSEAAIDCGGQPVRLTMKGRTATLAHVENGKLQLH